MFCHLKSASILIFILALSILSFAQRPENPGNSNPPGLVISGNPGGPPPISPSLNRNQRAFEAILTNNKNATTLPIFSDFPVMGNPSSQSIDEAIKKVQEALAKARPNANANPIAGINGNLPNERANPNAFSTPVTPAAPAALTVPVTPPVQPGSLRDLGEEVRKAVQAALANANPRAIQNTNSRQIQGSQNGALRNPRAQDLPNFPLFPLRYQIPDGQQPLDIQVVPQAPLTINQNSNAFMNANGNALANTASLQYPGSLNIYRNINNPNLQNLPTRPLFPLYYDNGDGAPTVTTAPLLQASTGQTYQPLPQQPYVPPYQNPFFNSMLPQSAMNVPDYGQYAPPAVNYQPRYLRNNWP